MRLWSVTVSSMPCCGTEITHAQTRNWCAFMKALQSGDTDKARWRIISSARLSRSNAKCSQSSPMIETLAARVKLAPGQTAEAFDIYRGCVENISAASRIQSTTTPMRCCVMEVPKPRSSLSASNCSSPPMTYAFTSYRRKAMKRWGTRCRSTARRRKSIRGRAIFRQPLNNCRSR